MGPQQEGAGGGQATIQPGEVLGQLAAASRVGEEGRDTRVLRNALDGQVSAVSGLDSSLVAYSRLAPLLPQGLLHCGVRVLRGRHVIQPGNNLVDLERGQQVGGVEAALQKSKVPEYR